MSDIGDVEGADIPLPNVSSGVLKKILEYCEHHKDDEPPQSTEGNDAEETKRRQADIGEWDQKFIQVSAGARGAMQGGLDTG